MLGIPTLTKVDIYIPIISLNKTLQSIFLSLGWSYIEINCSCIAINTDSSSIEEVAHIGLNTCLVLVKIVGNICYLSMVYSSIAIQERCISTPYLVSATKIKH